MSLFDTLSRAGLLRPLDQALAQALRRLDAAGGIATPDAVLVGAALASRAVSEGHAAFDPTRADGVDDDAWPSPEAWHAAWRASPWIAQPSSAEAPAAAAPLVVEDGLLYLRRYREYERRLALGLRRIASQSLPLADVAPLHAVFRSLFPKADAEDAQAQAAARALDRALLLVTGGPGTGKTTAIARMLLLRIAQAHAAGAPVPRIALAAPTGRAAERMAASLRHATATLRATPGIDAAWCDALPDAARTLHRLLGPIPDSPRFRHDGDHPLPHDIVVVDEASMVDLPLMCKLVDAIGPHAQLILIGDPDQLPSVEAGDVLASIVEAAGDAGPAGASEAALLGRDAMPSTGDLFDAAARAPLAGHRVHLRRGYRQAKALQLAPLAEAVRAGDGARALALLEGGTLAGVTFHRDLVDPLADVVRDALLAPLRALREVDSPDAALAMADRARVLTALRDGPAGAGPLNARIEEALAGAHHAPYFAGRLLLVTENSERHALANGDVGVCLPDDAGTMVAWFAGRDGARGFHPAALPAHAGAFAMTVHKAQGSEYDTAWLVLPRTQARTLSRELVYTGITRARIALHVCAGADVLRFALAHRVERVSGLRRRLAEPL